MIDRACEADSEGDRYDGHESAEDGHGRHEERYVTVVHTLEGLSAEWPGVATAVQINREREVGGERTVTSHYDISSHKGTAADFSRWVGGHWDIEDGLHWILEVVVREDRSRIRAANAGANLAMIRRVAVSLLRWAPGKGSGVTKRLKAGWDDGYLPKIIQGIPASIVR